MMRLGKCWKSIRAVSKCSHSKSGEKLVEFWLRLVSLHFNKKFIQVLKFRHGKKCTPTVDMNMMTPSKIGTKIRCIITCCVRGSVDENVDEEKKLKPNHGWRLCQGRSSEVFMVFRNASVRTVFFSNFW